jgi:hypothetical protein
MRHLDWLLDDLGLNINKANRKKVDLALRKHFGFSETDECPVVWDKVKSLSDEEKLELSEKIEL